MTAEANKTGRRERDTHVRRGHCRQLLRHISERYMSVNQVFDELRQTNLTGPRFYSPHPASLELTQPGLFM